jgi:DNA-binding transcriptional MerR regulator
MTIKEVCERFDITADTLRYYERVGAIPEVARTAGGIRNYTEEDLKWINNALCLRGAGVPVEMIIEYVKLFRQGDDTFEARCNLLKEARTEVLAAREKYDKALDKLNYKIRKYEEAVRTGILVWDQEQVKEEQEKQREI